MASKRSYVGAVRDYDSDSVLVWERDENGRHLRILPCEYYFFAPLENGRYKSILGYNLERYDFETEDEMKQALRQVGGRVHESDIAPHFKALMNYYCDLPTPVVHFAFLDIEVDYRAKHGFAGPSNPYGIINAVTIYQSWTGGYKQYLVPPLVNGVRWSGTVEDIKAEFTRLMDEGNLTKGIYPEIVICKTEAELLQHLVADIQDADIISGWNSEFYDLPYIIKRLELVWPKMVAKLCFAGCKPPREREREKFGSPEKVYSLSGRAHLDYKELFEKFTFEGRESYALGNILAEEIGMGKLHYDGTLEQLYQNAFPTFAAYNFRDVSGMVDLDDKFKFIQLVNQMSHENTCLFENMLGTVRYVETGIANFAHNTLQVRVPDKQMMNDDDKVEGALVLNPSIGMHEYIGSVDITSLYPKTIESLNISPEMFVGQFSEGEEAWSAIIRGHSIAGDAVPDDTTFRLNEDNRDFIDLSVAEWRDVIKEQKWAVSAYGTIFRQGEGIGLVPSVLSFWFAERKRLQNEKKKWGAKVRDLETVIKKDGTNDKLSSDLKEAEKQRDHYDLLQLTKKIQLNSTYGALLNKNFRFGRKEMGASVTACGRQITTHMMHTIHAFLEPENPQKMVKTTEVDKDGVVSNAYIMGGCTVIYGDTDSVDGASLIRTSHGDGSIAKLFMSMPVKWNVGEKEFATAEHLTTSCLVDGSIVMKPVKAIYRHRVSKPRWKVTLEDGRSVVMTDDHSIMVMRAGNLIEVKPSAINRDTDTCVSIGTKS
jgi:DNA polymerase elongation subunit (family B)